jgi:hemoglobin
VAGGVSTTTGSVVIVGDDLNVHDAVGGEVFFADLVEHFYQRVATDLLLRPLYPDDLSASKRHMAMFLQQYWGGPGTYSEERGHPRLRQRHLPFVISEAERDAWLGHMIAALGVVARSHQIGAAIEQQIAEYFANTADFLVNAR